MQNILINMCEMSNTVGLETTEPYGIENLMTTKSTRTTFVAIGTRFRVPKVAIYGLPDDACPRRP